MYFGPVDYFILGDLVLLKNISSNFRPKAGLLNRGALLTLIHFAGDQTPPSFTEQCLAGILLVSNELELRS